jgi:hypothetical protein
MRQTAIEAFVRQFIAARIAGKTHGIVVNRPLQAGR